MSDAFEMHGLSGRAAKSAAWIVGARLLTRFLGFFSTIVLARLLAPDDFGLVAIALTAMQLLLGLSDIGMSQAVIRFRDADRADLDTLFTLSAIRGGLIALFLVAAAPLAAGFYGDARFAEVFLGIAAAPLLAGFVNPKFYEFERDLDLSKEFFVSAADKLVGVAVSVSVALLTRSYAAIIAGMLAGGVVQLALSYALRPYAPRFTLASFRKVFGFSGWLAGVSVMAALNNKLDAFILGRAIGASGTGVYYLGRQLAELPTSELASPIARALYPGLTALQGESERMRLGFLKGVAALGAVALPASIGFAFVADDLVHILIGPKWDEAAHVIAVLTPVLGIQTLFLATQYFAMALGLTRLVFVRELIFFLVRTPVFIWAAVSHGLPGAAFAVAATGLVHAGLNLALYAQATRRPPTDPVWAARRSIGATLVMAAVLFVLEAAVHAGQAALVRVLIETSAGAAAYVAALAALWAAEGRPEGVERWALALLARATRRR